MIMINGSWEQVNDLSDILRIISENIGNEFAQKVEEICEDQNESLNYMKERIDRLGEYIDDHKDGSDYMKGMEDAYNMI